MAESYSVMRMKAAKEQLEAVKAQAEKVKRYKARISKGVKWLNATKPNWFKKINVDSLDLGDSTSCILGQAFDSYWYKVRQAGEAMEDDKMEADEAHEHGFVEATRSESDYDLLSSLWFDQVMALKKKARKKR